MFRMRRWALAAAMAALTTCIAAGSVLAADSPVTIAGLAFAPATVTIQVGDSVTWTNEDSVPHTATSGDGSFDTGQLADGDSETITFDAAGTFAYICSIHPQMAGTVVVQGAAATPAPTAAPTTGGSVTLTPAPTDTHAATANEDLASSAVAIALAALGVLMLVGTFAADRRFHERREE